MGVFFLCGSWDVCLQSAGSVHPFRTRIFPSSCERNRLCRKANPPEIFVPAPCGAGTRHLTQAQCEPVTSSASIPPASTAPLCREPQSPSSSHGVGLGDLEDSTLPRAHTGSRRLGISSGSCSPSLGAAASLTACSDGWVWYLIPNDMTGISRRHLLSVCVRNVSLAAPRAGGPAESFHRADTQPPAPQGCMAK